MKPFEVEVLEKSIEQKGNMLKSCYDDDIFKSWSGDLQKRFPNGNWKTVNGAKVFVNGGKVVAGLAGFNGEIDKFFDGKGKGGNYNTPKGKMSWGEIVDKYESDIKSLDSFFKKKSIDSKKIGRETIKGKLKLSNVSLGLNKEFRNEKEANEWINGEGKDLYEKEVEKRKEAYKEFKESQKSEGKGQDTKKEEKGKSLSDKIRDYNEQTKNYPNPESHSAPIEFLEEVADMIIESGGTPDELLQFRPKDQKSVLDIVGFKRRRKEREDKNKKENKEKTFMDFLSPQKRRGMRDSLLNKSYDELVKLKENKELALTRNFGTATKEKKQAREDLWEIKDILSAHDQAKEHSANQNK